MSRADLFRVYVLAAIAIAAVAVVWTFTSALWTTIESLLFFAALVAVAVWVRIDEQSPGFESAVVFAAILLLHDPAVALISIFVGTAVCRVAEDARRRTFRLESLYDAAQLALSYYVALLYSSAVAKDAPLMAKVSGYILLVIGYLVARTVFAAIGNAGTGEPLDVRRLLITQSTMLGLMTPVVAAEVVCDSIYGMPGFALGFLPVLVIAHAMRNESDATTQNAELIRRNRELPSAASTPSPTASCPSSPKARRRFCLPRAIRRRCGGW